MEHMLRIRHLDNCSCGILPSAIFGGRMSFFKKHPCFTTYFFAAVPSENTLTILKPTKISVPLILKVLLIMQLDPQGSHILKVLLIKQHDPQGMSRIPSNQILIFNSKKEYPENAARS
jgi:hypothetical protein